GSSRVPQLRRNTRQQPGPFPPRSSRYMRPGWCSPLARSIGIAGTLPMLRVDAAAFHPSPRPPRENPRAGSVACAMNTPQTTLLVTLTGRDRPGVTARLFSVLARHELDVIDAEQVVIRGRLVLGVLLGCPGLPDLTSIHRAVSAVA